MSPIGRSLITVCRMTILLSAANFSARADEPVVQQFGEWRVTIQPGVRGSAPTDRGSPSGLPRFRLIGKTKAEDGVVPPSPEPAAEANGSEKRPDPRSLVRLYSQVYNSIPFSRAEYNATPSYRHDATMEFLFGQMRSTVIQRGTTVIRQRNSAMPYGYGGGYGYGYGYGYPYNPYGFTSYYYPFYYMGYNRPYDLW